MSKIEKVIKFIKDIYPDGFIPLHAPVFNGNEKKYLNEVIDSTFVSSVGECIVEAERMLEKLTGNKYCTLVVNGTAALHAALKVAGVKEGDEIITQSLTFVATCNAISYLSAKCVFVDVDNETLGICPIKLDLYLKNISEIKNGECLNRFTGNRISALIMMHTFGHIGKVEEVAAICKKYKLTFIEDAAEALGSTRNDHSFGKFSDISITSFNGNKIVTSGGGGAIFTNNENLHKRFQHITKTSKINHPYEFIHDEIGFNYRMPNLNAALLKAQLEQLGSYLSFKRDLAKSYHKFFAAEKIDFINEPPSCSSNFWLNGIVLKNLEERDLYLKTLNGSNIMSRPLWTPMHQLPMFKDCTRDNLDNTDYFYERVINIPSGVVIG